MRDGWVRNRRLRRAVLARVAFAVVLVMAFSACEFVYPTPPPGAPIPTIQFSLSEAEPVAGQFTITATPANFNPHAMGFRLDDYRSPTVYTDTTAPFTYTLNTRDLAPGAHQIWASAGDGTYTVRKVFKPTYQFRPNIVTIQVDDLDQMTTPYWDAMPKTKALIADAGLTFSNAFVTAPTCCPSRTSLLTGRYPQNTGVYDNSPPDGGYSSFGARASNNDNIATRLQAEGYTTAFLGKFLNLYNPLTDPVPPGWNEWYGTEPGPLWNGFGYYANHNGTPELRGWDPTDYEVDVLSQHATSFIDAAAADHTKPFYLQVNTLAPHANVGPPPRYQPNPFANAALPTSPNFNEADVSDKPTWLRDGFPVVTPELLQQATDAYRNAFGSLLAVDDMVAAVVQRLQADNELDHTVFVFLSDNGMNWRSHRLWHKMVPYEESIRVPLIMMGPGVPHGTNTDTVANIDYAPTLLELAGAGPQLDLDGRSLVPLLKGDSSGWRSDLLIQYKGTYGGLDANLDTLADVQAEIARAGSLTLVPTYRALRTNQWLYVEWYGGSVHEYELYDLVNDSFELNNLLSTPAGVAANATLTASLQARLESLASCAGASCRS